MTNLTFAIRQVVATAGREVALLLGFSAVMGGLLTFGLIAEEVAEGDADRFDRLVLGWFGYGPGGTGPLGSPRLHEFGRDVTALGSHACLGFVTLTAVGYLLLIGRRGLAALAAAAVAGGMILSPLLKALFNRPRPDVLHAVQTFSPSFPSGHAMLSTITFLTLAAILGQIAPSRAARLYILCIALLLSVAIGISRVYLGVHYPSDVMAGWSVGGAWAALCWMAGRLIARRRDRITIGRFQSARIDQN